MPGGVLRCLLTLSLLGRAATVDLKVETTHDLNAGTYVYDIVNITDGATLNIVHNGLGTLTISARILHLGTGVA